MFNPEFHSGPAMSSKSRMISFRLSSEEYLRFHEACIVFGTNSISELARMAMHRLIDPPDRRDLDVHEQFCNLRLRLEDLTLEVSRLGKAVDQK